MEEGDEPLESAYKKSLDCAREAELEAVAFSLLSAGVCRGKRTVRQVHAIWLLHMVWQWDVWTEMMHPDGSMTPTFFMMTHVVFLAMSALLCVQPEPSAASKKKSS